jgi:hypothetical protein
MTDLAQRPVLSVPGHQRARLGWWHGLVHRLLLLGHSDPPPPPPISDAPPPIRDLTLLLEHHRMQFAAAARTLSADYKGGYWMMYLLAPLAVLTAAAATSFGYFGSVLSGLELFVITLILLLFIAMRRGRWQEGWIRARRTAEHLRYLPLVAPFVGDVRSNWYEQLAVRHGTRVVVDPEVTRVCEWLGAGTAARHSRLNDPASCTAFVEYLDASLAQQVHYHGEKATIEHALTRRISLISTGFFCITIGCTALLFAESTTRWFVLDHYVSSHLLRFLATGLPAVGAGLRGLLAQGESHRVAALSEGMSLRLAQLRTELAKLTARGVDATALENLVWDAVQELLSEADTWMRLQESVPLSISG